MLSPNVFFLAHPVASDTEHSMMQNLRHIETLAGLCFEAGLMVIAPYYLTCMVLDDEIPEQRALGMQANDIVIQKLGRIILTGHKISSGMAHELELVNAMKQKEIVNLVGVKDTIVVGFLQELFTVRG